MTANTGNMQMPNTDTLTVADRFAIFEQLHAHQRAIDGDATREAAQAYVDLYWPEATFTVHDLRHATFEGPDGLKHLYDYAHSVFPLDTWWHDLGPFAIKGAGDEARAEWRWIVDWKADREGIVSTGQYADLFQKRNGVWKCLERTSTVDPNWPAALFQPFVDREKDAFRAS